MLSYKIVEEHQGHICFESEVNVGTTVSVMLPLRQNGKRVNLQDVEEVEHLFPERYLVRGRSRIFIDCYPHCCSVGTIASKRRFFLGASWR